MIRFVVGVVVALVVAVPATLAAAPPKTATVTNPLTADLDAAGHNITNAGQVAAVGVYSAGNIVTDSTLDSAALLSRTGRIYLETPQQITISAGPKDPAAEGERAGVGSLYIRTGPPELWQKTGDTDTGWTKR